MTTKRPEPPSPLTASACCTDCFQRSASMVRVEEGL